MLDEQRAADIFARVKRFASVDEVEVLFTSSRFFLTRFANNGIHQNVAEDGFIVSVRTAFDGKTARATTNKSDDDSLKRAVRAAEQLTRVQETDPDLLPMAGAQANPNKLPTRYFDSTARMSPDDRAEGVRKIVAIAKRSQRVTAGIFSSGESFEGIINSRGLRAFHRQTLAEISITMLNDAEASSGWQKANSPDVRNLDPVRLAETAAQKARDSAHPKEIPAGKYTVVLEPSATLDLVGFMFWDFSAQGVLDERSFLTNRLGTKTFGESISVYDDAYHPLQAGAPFDGEGMPRQRITLIENGVAKSVVYSRANAEKMKRSDRAASAGEIQPTGHGLPLPNDIGDIPVNIVFAPPQEPKTVEQMIASTERGILVTRVWYIREVEPYEKIYTGMTRDGTFLIENGKVKHGIRNFRFNQSAIETLNKVEMMGTPQRTSGEEAFEMVVPALKVRDFNFTEVTKF